MLAFDSQSIHYLLSSKHESLFDPKFPIIYRTKISSRKFPFKHYFNSAIDLALKNNQAIAVSALLDYIVKYQNNYVSSYLFRSNFSLLI